MVACFKSPLFLPSLLYFCFFAIAATSGRFISLFFLDKGLNDAEVGFILGSGAFASLLSKPLLGYFADTRGSRICLLGGAIMSSFMFLTNILDGEAVGMSRFHWILILWVARTPWNVAPVLDAFTVKYLAKAAEAKNATSDASTTDKAAATAQYGRCRLWGAVSWATTNLILGVFMDDYGIANVMYIACIFTTICFVGLVCVTVPSFDEECKEQALALSIAAAADTDTNEEEEYEV
jgi:PPP family 3-phenylpropionic acid transporter